MSRSTEDIQSYFTWQWTDCTNKSKDFLKNQIAEIEKTIKFEEIDKKRNLPQLYALKGYLLTQVDVTIKKNLQDAEDCFEKALKNCKENNEGYKKVIYGSLTHLQDLKVEVNKKIDQSNAEVLAMQAHAAAYLQNYQEAIDFYEKALKEEKEGPDKKETPEWLFGLALALIPKNVGRNNKFYSKKIECLLRHAIQLDDSYHLAKLKLAKNLLISRRKYGDEEIYDLVNPIIDKNKLKENESKENESKENESKENESKENESKENELKENESKENELKENESKENEMEIRKKVAFLEEAANVIKDLKIEKAEEIFLDCYKAIGYSQKTLRGLGVLYSELWEKKTRGKKQQGNEVDDEEIEKHLADAIKYLEENATGKHFDIILIANQHRKAYEYYNKHEPEKATYHKNKCEKLYEQLIDQLEAGEFDAKSKLDVCYRLSEFYKTFSDGDKEKEYLKQTLHCASKGTEEDNFEYLSFVRLAQSRLLELADGLKTDSEKYKGKSDVFKLCGDIERSIFYLKEVVKVSGEGSQEIKFEEAQLLLSLIKKKKKYGLDDEQTMNETETKIGLIEDEERKEKLEIEFQRMKIDKRFTDAIVNDLKEDRLNLENKPTMKSIFAVLDKSKILLERCIAHINQKVFPEVTNKKSYLYQIDFKTCKSKEQRIKTIDTKFKNEYKWSKGEKKFSSILPQLAKSFTEFLDVTMHPYLPIFIKIRNKGQHDFETNQIALLFEKCPSVADQKELTRKASNYAVEVWNCVKEEVDKYINKNDN